MSTTRPETPPVPDEDAQAFADFEEVCRLVAEGKRVTDPDLRQRITERADRAREETLRLFGVQEIAVDIVREMRDPKV